MLLINNQEVEKLFDMKACLAALEDAYDDLLIGDAVYRPRLDLWMPCDRPDGYWRWGTMEGASRKIGVFAIRMKSDVVYWPNEETEEKYCMQPGTWCGLVMVFSVRNGEPLAIINDGLIQHMRVRGTGGQISLTPGFLRYRHFRFRRNGAKLSGGFLRGAQAPARARLQPDE